MAKGQKKRKKTDANVKKLEIALKNGLTRESACVHAGISRQTMHNWINTDPDFLRMIEDSEEYWIGVVEEIKKRKVMEGYRPAVDKELKSRRRSVYGDKQEIDQNIKGVEVIKIGQKKDDDK